MCGIAGIVSVNEIENREWLSKACNTMVHRGPDDHGYWWAENGKVGFGHRRLSIIDLSKDGHQPMINTTGDIIIVLNGEIYNYLELKDKFNLDGYHFRSKSDTEVVLAAYQKWGKDCVSHLTGMFALAIYDLKAGTLFLARDRAGEKPLFYSLHNGTIKFSSELKGILSDSNFNARLNPQAFDCFLAEGYVPGELCIIDGVNKLPPGHALLFHTESGESKSWAYWELPPLTQTGAELGEQELLEEFERLFEDAVDRQLVADVPVGVLLSGGVDSSLVTAMAARSNSKVRTFTITFPDNEKYDEKKHARLIADYFGTEHTELEAQASDVDLLPLLAAQYDEPIIDSSMVPTYLVSKLVREHCTVALGGDGGDELFGGYSHYSRLLWLQSKFGSLPLPFRSILSQAAARFMPMGAKGRNWIQALGVDFNSTVPLVASYYDQRNRLQLLKNTKFVPGMAEGIRESRIPSASGLLQRATRTDFYNYLPEDILVKVDRASMLNSLELRAPFLDHKIIEFAFARVPSSLKTSASERKILLKRLASKILPPEFDKQRKQGFNVPLSDWLLSGPWVEYFKAVLLDPSQNLFDHRFIENMIEGQKKGHNNGERLFGLVMFVLWSKKYNVNF